MLRAFQAIRNKNPESLNLYCAVGELAVVSGTVVGGLYFMRKDYLAEKKKIQELWLAKLEMQLENPSNKKQCSKP